MFAFVLRHRRLIACLAIALQGLGAFVGGLGHTHYGDAACCSAAIGQGNATPHSHHGGKCSHGHNHAAPSHEHAHRPAQQQQQPSGPHDDCSLCRHFSQPVSPVTLVIDVPRCDCSQSLDVVPIEQISAAAVTTHPARGPPAASA